MTKVTNHFLANMVDGRCMKILTFIERINMIYNDAFIERENHKVLNYDIYHKIIDNARDIDYKLDVCLCIFFNKKLGFFVKKQYASRFSGNAHNIKNNKITELTSDFVEFID